ncbi:MAG: hypothetical protein WCP22_07885 [Chlamydiota bacterium]
MKAASQMVALASGGPVMEQAIPSRSAFKDPFAKKSIDGLLVHPVPPVELCFWKQRSSILPQIIRALEVGIESYGYDFIIAEEMNDEKEKAAIWAAIKGEINPLTGLAYAKTIEELLNREIELCERFYDYFSPFESFIDIRRKFRNDRETVGAWAMEVLRDGFGIPCGGEHVPAHEVGLLEKDDTATEIEFARIGRDWKWVTDTRPVFFRRYVQIKGGSKRYYRQFGDPRPLSYINGKTLLSADAKSAATEIIYAPVYVPGTDYGLPDWSSQIYNIGGSHLMEKGNMSYFANSMIPAIFMAILGGGKVTQEELKKLAGEFEKVKGDPSQTKLLAVQLPAGMAENDPTGKANKPDLVLKFLKDQQRNDATHTVYGKINDEKLLSSRAVPPIAIGRSGDYTRATVFGALSMFEDRTCRPERNQFDWTMNRIIVEMRVRFHEFQSRGPDLSDPDSIARLVDACSRAGGLSINGCIQIANKALGTKVPPYPGPDGDLPIAVVLEKIRAQAALQGPRVALTAEDSEKHMKQFTQMFGNWLMHCRDHARRLSDAA